MKNAKNTKSSKIFTGLKKLQEREERDEHEEHCSSSIWIFFLMAEHDSECGLTTRSKRIFLFYKISVSNSKKLFFVVMEVVFQMSMRSEFSTSEPLFIIFEKLREE
jgi:hypothetical protein